MDHNTKASGKLATLATAAIVDLWHIGLAVDPSELCRLAELLDGAERARASHYRFDCHRRRYIVRRAAQRAILSEYLGLEPLSVCVATTCHGKPFLPGQSLRFNTSHRGELALLAVTREREVGVDIESVHPEALIIEALKPTLRPDEARFLSSIPKSWRPTALCRLWTAREAYLKGVGVGLADMSAVPSMIRLMADGSAQLVRGPTSAALGLWSLWPCPVPVGYCATLAIEGDVSISIYLHRWPNGLTS